MLLAYLLSNGLLLWRRCTGYIIEDESRRAELLSSKGNVKLAWGPWRVPGAAGTVINAVGVAYVAVVLFFGFWPSSTPADAVDMNYSAALLGFVIIACTVYYFARARFVYIGPRAERKTR